MELNQVVDVAAIDTTVYYFGILGGVFGATVAIYVFLRKVRRSIPAPRARAAEFWRCASGRG